MAVTSSIAYCSERDLFDVYPQIKTSDTKTRLFNWQDTGVSNRYKSPNSGLVTQLFSSGNDLGSAESSIGNVTGNDQWFYDSGEDVVYYYNSATNPNDLIMEAGEDFASLTQRYRENASRHLESLLDSRLAAEIAKDREGNYPYIIKRIASLIAVSHLIKSDDPASEVAEAFMEEANEYITGLRTGDIQLPHQVTGDSPYGFIRDVTYTSGKVRPVQTRGMYQGTYDLIKVVITTAGAIGSGKYSVFEKSSSDLKSTLIVDGETINGDFQQCAGGLEIRFAGGTDASTAALNDEWEIEVHGIGEDVRASKTGNINMSRGAYHLPYKRYKGGFLRTGHRKIRF
tara:strand:+ start:2288 stop:3313 length:1026 start_codon:yes stop_codon:yes gene_type:complete